MHSKASKKPVLIWFSSFPRPFRIHLLFIIKHLFIDKTIQTVSVSLFTSICLHRIIHLLYFQLSDAIALIGAEDFPEKWTNLLSGMVEQFKTKNFHIINGVLQTAHSLFKRWQFRHTFNYMQSLNNEWVLVAMNLIACQNLRLTYPLFLFNLVLSSADLTSQPSWSSVVDGFFYLQLFLFSEV